jgi:hypothetical protein
MGITADQGCSGRFRQTERFKQTRNPRIAQAQMQPDKTVVNVQVCQSA